MLRDALVSLTGWVLVGCAELSGRHVQRGGCPGIIINSFVGTMSDQVRSSQRADSGEIEPAPGTCAVTRLRIAVLVWLPVRCSVSPRGVLPCPWPRLVGGLTRLGLVVLLAMPVPIAAGRRASLLPEECGGTPAPTANWGAVPPDRAICADRVGAVVPNWGAVPDDAAVVSAAGEAIGVAVIAVDTAVAQAAGEIGSGGAVANLAGTGADGQAEIVSLSNPRWTGVNQWDPEILAAQQRVYLETGVLVPTTIIKAIIKLETDGTMPMEPNPTDGAGLMRANPRVLGVDRCDARLNEIDPGYSIYCGTHMLAILYADSQRRPWREVVVGYFAGPDGSGDGLRTDVEYQAQFDLFFAELVSPIPSSQPSTPNPPTRLPGEIPPAAIPADWLAGVNQSIAGLAAIWGYAPGYDGVSPAWLTQEFGPRHFSQFVRPKWYEYAIEYGFPGPAHTGLDIAVPANTRLYAPTDARVICAGSDNGTGEDSCAAYHSDYGGPTSGRLELELSNGDRLLLGHVKECFFAPGQQVTAGQEIGLSGSLNGEHLHLEYRIRDDSTTSRYRIIDPRLTPLNDLQVQSTTGPGAAPGPGSNWPTADAINALIELKERQNGHSSPLHGRGDLLIELGISYGVNPGVVVAVLYKETQLGADGSILPTQFNNFGGITGSGNCDSTWLIDRYWAHFCTVEEGLAANFAIFNEPQYRQTGGTMGRIIEIYSPTSDNNDPVAMWTRMTEAAEVLQITLTRSTNIYGGATGGGDLAAPTPASIPQQPTAEPAIPTEVPRAEPLPTAIPTAVPPPPIPAPTPTAEIPTVVPTSIEPTTAPPEGLPTPVPTPPPEA